ncbi:MAG: glycosyltransferase family 39 protein [Stygiobacter sp.]
MQKTEVGKFSTKNILMISFLFVPILLVTKIHFVNNNLVLNYSTLWIISSLFYLLANILIKKISMENYHIFFLIVLSVLTQLSFLNYEPIGSDDIYRYMWDGKVQANNINPYSYKPIDKELNELHSDILPSKMNYKEMKTIYFPLSQWLFYVGFKISGENFWGYKFLIFISIIISIVLLYKILVHLNMEKKRLLFFILSPLIYFQFSIDGHLDAFGLPLLISSLYFYLKDKKFYSAFFLGLSFSIKPVAIVLIPLFFLNEKSIADKFKFLIVTIFTFLIQFTPYIFSSNPFEAFIIFSKNWMFNGFIFTTINSIIHNNQLARLITWICLIISLLPIYFGKIELIKKFYFAILLMIIFSPVIHPWYLSWLLIFIPFTNFWSGIYLVSAVSLTSITILVYKMTGNWKDYYVVQMIEFIPTIVLMIYELFKLTRFTTNDNSDKYAAKA